MCDIWKMKDQPELEVGEYLKLPKSLRYINVSGGEPFVRLDLVRVVENIHRACPRGQIIISTNGLLPETIGRKVKAIKKFYPEIGAGVSLDGIGEMHDKIRGIPGAFHLAIKTLNELKKLDIQNIRMAFTVSAINVTHLSRVYELAHSMGVQFTMALAQSSDFYFGGKQVKENIERNILKKEFDFLIKNELKGFRPKRWLRAYFADGLYNFALTQKQPLESQAGRQFFFMDPMGQIYPSVVHNYVMGNLSRVNNFGEIWHSGKAAEVREKVRKDKRPAWMICTARTAIRRNPIKVLRWAAGKKLGK